MHKIFQFFNNQFVPVGAILGLALIIAALIGAWTAITVKNANNTLTVTGSATANVSADTAKWTVTDNRTVFQADIPSATTQVIADTKLITAFFTDAGISASNITLGAVHTNQDYSYMKSDVNTPTQYTVSQSVTVTSDNPKLIQKLSQNTSSLTDKGLILNVQDPQYFLSNLPQYRISLAGAAMQDARARAEQIVKGSGSVGPLRSASTGAVQVMAANSIDVSDFGTYDTSTIEKTVMVTVRATFSVN